MHKLKLHGFNNLTKSLSFCIYDICYAKTADDRDGYIAYIDEQYNANRLTEILSETCSIIGANILNIARQDYEPQGASVTIWSAKSRSIRKTSIRRNTPARCRTRSLRTWTRATSAYTPTRKAIRKAGCAPFAPISKSRPAASFRPSRR